MAKVTFSKEKTIEVLDTSQSLLDVALSSGIPHEHACGGNALCSTCRVLVIEGEHNLCPRNEAEMKLAKAKGLEDRVRLACQTKFLGDVTLRRLVHDKDDINLAVQQNIKTTGKQQKVAVLFSDIRQFTPFVESNLAYDVVHILNRYFYQMGQSVLRHNGLIDKYLGDGMMALFGVDSSCPKQTCLDAVAAALDMLKELDVLNQYLQSHFGHCMEIGIGIDFGEVLLGDLGHPDKKSLTAIGNTVNVAARIEAATKQFKAKLLVSDAVYSHINHYLVCNRFFNTELKGTTNDHLLHEVVGLNCDTGETDVYDLHFNRLRDKVSRAQAPGLLRLAFHQSFSYDPQSKTGGMNGSLLYSDEWQRPENAGLEDTVSWLKQVKADFQDISCADLIALSAAVAIQLCNGPKIRLRMGRTDGHTASRTGLLPDESHGLDHIITRFNQLGFTEAEMVALSGAHTLGKANGKALTPDLFTFNNNYFKELLRFANTESGDEESLNEESLYDELEPCHLLASDKALLQHPNCRQWVQKYAIDENLFFTDFAPALQKMLELGAMYE